MKHAGKFVVVEGVIRQKSDVRPQVTSAKFECPSCGNIISVLQVESIFKVGEGRPNVVDWIKNDEIDLVINTPMGAQARYDEESIGRSCIQKGIVAITTLSGAEAAVRAIRLSNKTIHVHSIQEYHL